MNSTLVELFEKASRLTFAQQEEMLAAIGRDDAVLRDALLRLLRADRESKGFLEPGGREDKALSESARGYLAQCEHEALICGCRVVGGPYGGGYGDVFKCIDAATRETIAIKRLTKSVGWPLQQFQNEYRQLSKLNHPNLVKVYDLIEDEKAHSWFIKMEFIEGVSLDRYVRPYGGGALDFGRLTAAFRQLVEAVIALHRAQMLHGDISPNNILVDGSGRVKLFDLGLVRTLGSQYSVVVGTLGFVAPEVKQGGEVSPSSDWYSVGAVLRDLLFGSGCVFEGETAKCERQETELVAEPSVSPELRSLSSKLLDINPLSRPGGAEVLLALSACDQWPVVVADVASPLHEKPLVGRQYQLEQFKSAVEKVQSGGTVILNLTGSSGCGKTTIFEVFRGRVLKDYQNALFLSGRSSPSESVSFGAIRGVVGQIASYLRLQPDPSALLPRDCESLGNVFSEFCEVQGVSEAVRNSKADNQPQERLASAFAALVDLLGRIAERQLLVIFLDDLHWGDSDSAELFRYVIAESRSLRLLLVASYREDETGASPFLRLYRSYIAAPRGSVRVDNVDLHDLSEDDSRCLLRSRVAVSEDQFRIIFSESAGNPFLIEMFSRFLCAPSLGRDNVLVTMKEVLADRVGQLPADACTVLKFLAVAGRPLDDSLLLEMIPSVNFNDAVRILTHEKLVNRKDRANSKQLEVHHDKIRIAMLKLITESELKSIHEQLAEAEKRLSGDPALISIHLEKAGRTVDAAPFAEEAGDHAAQELAFDRAAHFYRSALNSSAPGQAVSFSLRTKLASALANGGRLADAADEYLVAADLADSIAGSAEMKRRAAEQYLRSEKIDKGIKILRELGKSMRIRVSANPKVALAYLFAYRFLIRLRGFEFQERPVSRISAEDQARLDVYWSLATGLGFLNPIVGAGFMMRALHLALRLGDARRVGLALPLESLCQTIERGSRDYERSQEAIRQARKIGQRIGDPHVLAFANTLAAACAWCTGRWKDACDLGVKAEHEMRTNCAGATWELMASRNIVLVGLLWRGEWRKAARLHSELMQVARGESELGTTLIPSSFHDLANDDPNAAHRTLSDYDERRTKTWSQGFNMPNVSIIFAKGDLLLYEGEVKRAYEFMEEQWPLLVRSMLLRVEASGILALAARGRCALSYGVALVALDRGQEAARCLGVAERCIRHIRSRNSAWGNALALLLEAGLQSTTLSNANPVPKLRAAVDLFEQADMGLFRSVTQITLGSMLGGQEGLDLIRTGQMFMYEQDIKCPTKMMCVYAPGFGARN